MAYFWIGLALLLALMVVGVILERRSGRSFSGSHSSLTSRVKRDQYGPSDFHQDSKG